MLSRQRVASLTHAVSHLSAEKTTMNFLRHFLLGVFFVAMSCVQAGSLNGKVIGVLDGDTVDVLDAAKTQHRIRLAGLDAPEKSQPFGQRSKQNLSDLVFGRQVEVQYTKNDKYGRIVGKILVNGKDANIEQIRGGFAWHYKQYEKEQLASDRVAYADAENKARAQKSGLWIDPKPTPPWEWRHGGAATSVTNHNGGECPCGGQLSCTGPRGGHYCLAPNGKKKY